MIAVTFVINNKYDEFTKIIDLILKKYKSLKCTFNIQYSTKYDVEAGLLSEPNKKALEESNSQKNPAIAFMDIDKIFISKEFWEKENQTLIILHELGHINYKLQFSDDTFLEGVSREFLADKYLSEVDSELINNRFDDWYNSNITSIKEVFKKPKERIYHLCKIYYIVKYYNKLNCVDKKINELIGTINSILTKIGIKEESSDEFNKYINKTLEECTEENIRSLDDFYEKNIENYLWYC